MKSLIMMHLSWISEVLELGSTGSKVMPHCIGAQTSIIKRVSNRAFSGLHNSLFLHPHIIF